MGTFAGNTQSRLPEKVEKLNVALEFSEKGIFDKNNIYKILATATVLEHYLKDFFILFETKPNTMFCGFCTKTPKRKTF